MPLHVCRYQVLAAYPFGAVPAWRVQFEAAHMSNADYDRAAALLHAHGYAKISGTYKARSVVFHHVHSNETLLPRRCAQRAEGSRRVRSSLARAPLCTSQSAGERRGRG